MHKPRAVYILEKDAFSKIYGPTEQAEIASLVEVIAPAQNARDIATRPDLLEQAEIILSGWGAPVLDARFLAQAPHLQAFFYGAGSVRYFTTPVFWRSGIRLTSAYGANAVPVMEYTVSAILLSLKHFFKHALAGQRPPGYYPQEPIPGAFGSRVGLISLGMIGRMVAAKLAQHDVEVLAYDPCVSQEACDRLGLRVAMVADLETIFSHCDVVSLHAPRRPETEGMITGRLLRSMRPGSTFINTARGHLVREGELIAVLRERPDLWAILDVVAPEPPAADNPLLALPNVLLTPHIAGSVDTECRRMGRYVISELRNYLAGKPLEWEIDEQQARLLA